VIQAWQRSLFGVSLDAVFARSAFARRRGVHIDEMPTPTSPNCELPAGKPPTPNFLVKPIGTHARPDGTLA
jgi:hypothetical protein